ncbi:hypothetical protein SbBS512_0013 (plasmid) [Shigella boydii CDC 3083-94]|uniref:Uncharacterized protein n=2 Tax=Enterobacteriaceae TaxID=543 RepID=A0A1L4BL42_ECOLX|nr:hypothetical protein SbBS512_0013 [Shigella boydii CDC 3083-94]API82032.1 hypothetical protein pECMCR-1101-0046 [Escherichia coli]KHG56095.1 hypothetical protein T636_A4506 [Enterobacter hormaechei subsp. xiangfangensis]ASK38395.1 hypothetical protein [Escherichia coli]ATZ71664.1 Hypothetical protein [Escherichia coli]
MLFISFFITVKYHFIFLLKEPAAGTGKNIVFGQSDSNVNI